MQNNFEKTEKTLDDIKTTAKKQKRILYALLKGKKEELHSKNNLSRFLNNFIPWFFFLALCFSCYVLCQIVAKCFPSALNEFSLQILLLIIPIIFSLSFICNIVCAVKVFVTDFKPLDYSENDYNLIKLKVFKIVIGILGLCFGVFGWIPYLIYILVMNSHLTRTINYQARKEIEEEIKKQLTKPENQFENKTSVND